MKVFKVMVCIAISRLTEELMDSEPAYPEKQLEVLEEIFVSVECGNDSYLDSILDALHGICLP